MRLTFRQGIVQYQQPSFLSVGSNYVDLIVTDTPTVLTLATGGQDYLIIEQKTVLKAWINIVAGVDQWLYWDINPLTAERTFGRTLLVPVVSGIKPSSPSVDQHWFDLTTFTMNVWNGTRWVPRLRVFACKLSNGSVPISVSNQSPTSFAGTQVGSIPGQYFSGQILFDAATSRPIRRPSGDFVTTEDELTTKSIVTSQVKFASLVVQGTAQVPIPVYSIVKYSNYGEIVLADQFTPTQVPFGILQQAANTGDVVNVTTSGAVTNPLWDFTVAGGGIGDLVLFPTALPINSLLYTNATGQLTSVPSIPDQVPVATVIDVRTILLQTPKSDGSGGGTTVAKATSSSYGIVRLNIPPTVPTDPVVIGDNDPRVVLAVLRTGDTMTGYLTLNADPVNPLEAATKQYVDTATQLSLDDLTDVDLTLPSSGQVLTFNGTNWVNAPAGGVAEPLNQIVYGTGSGVSSEAGFTWVAASNTLTLGIAGQTGTITNGDGGTVTFDSGSIIFSTNSISRLEIETTGAWLVGGTPGIAGQVLASNGPGVPPTWQAIGGTGTVTSVNITPGTGITSTGGPITTSGSITVGLTNTGVTANIYGSASQVGTLTVNAQGRLTAASNVAIQIAQSQVTNLVTDLAGKQPLDSTLTALSGYNTNGLLTQTAPDTFTGRTITGTTNRITLTNGDGVAGNPTIDISSSYVGQSSITTVGTITSGTWNGTTIAIANGGTGQTTANDALNALLPTQTGNAGEVLTTDGTNATWQPLAGSGTVTSVDVVGGVGLSSSGGPITTSGVITVDLDNTAVTPSTYGNATNVASFTVDAQGRLTFAGNVPITFPPSGVTSVFGRTGAVVAVEGDYTLDQLGDVTITSPAAGAVLIYNGSVWVDGQVNLADTDAVTGTLPIANGGTGQVTANAAFNALAPTQTGNAGEYLTTDGTNTSWAPIPGGTSFQAVLINNDVVTLAPGTPVYISSANNVQRADAATSFLTADMLGFVTSSTPVLAAADVQVAGLLTLTTVEWDVITGGSGGLLVNTVYYLNTVLGQITDTAPSNPGEFIVRVGKAVSSTQLFINIQPPIGL